MNKIKEIQVDALVVLKMLKDESGILLGVDYDNLLIVTNAVPDESYASALQEINYESNIVGFFSSDNLKLLVDIKQKEYPNCIGIQIEDGRIFGFRLTEKHEGEILEKIPISIKNASLIDAALTEFENPTSYAKNNDLQEMIDLVDLLQQDSWKQLHKKKRGEFKILAEHVKFKILAESK